MRKLLSVLAVLAVLTGVLSWLYKKYHRRPQPLREAWLVDSWDEDTQLF